MFFDYSIKSLFRFYILLLLFSFSIILTLTSTQFPDQSSSEIPKLPPLELQKAAEQRLEGRLIISEDSTSYPSMGPLRPEMNVDADHDFDNYIHDQSDDSSEDQDDDITFIPIPPVKQLPFCNHKAPSLELGENDKPPDNQDHVGEDSNSNDTIVLSTDGHGRRHKNDVENGKFILVATLDGKLFMMDSINGKILWSVGTGNIFSSTISSLQLSDQGKYIKLIPSLTGGLYKYDGDSLQAIPLNADSLLKTSFKLAQDVLITGGKELKTFGINIDSGSIKYECGFDGCKSPTTEEVGSHNTSTSGIVLVVRKQLQTVRAVDSLTGTERWNFSVGTHELALAGITEGCYEGADHDNVKFKGQKNDDDFKMLIPEGLLFKLDKTNQSPLWKQKFDNPISQAWILEDGKLVSIDPIKSSPPSGESDSTPSLYVGIHKQQLYVQESQTISNLLRSTFEIEDSSDNTSTSMGKEPLKLEWKPSIPSSSNAEMNPIPIDDDNTNTAHAIAPYTQSYIPPFFVYEEDRIPFPAIEAPPNTSSSAEDSICVDGDEKLDQIEDSDDEEDIEEVRGNSLDLDEDDPLTDTVTMGLVTLWFWWKEVLGISLLTAVILNILLMRPVVQIVRNRTIQEMLRNVNFFRLFRDQNVPALLPAGTPQSFRHSTSSETLVEGSGSSPSPSSPQILDNRNRTISASSAHSSNEDQQLVPFESQYLKEFEPIQCLGKGAFGTVFEARKIIDDRFYAVKRIPLPNRPKSRDRVMREVKSLAKLEHKFIVRYFNAWIENPPQGWLEKNDPLWNLCKSINSPTQTMSEYSNTKGYLSGLGSGDYSQIPSYMSHRKKDYSEIFVPDKTPTDDDSFIVFEASPEGSIDQKYNRDRDTIPEEEIENSGEESDSPSDNEWDSDSSLSSAPDAKLSKNDDNSNSKFFIRPTTLDIPSSTENSKAGGREVSLDFSTPTSATSEITSIMFLYIQQELCQKRTLQDWLRTQQNRNLSQVLKIFSQIIEAVEYIHSNNLIHRDLKPGNIFLAGGNGADDQENITIKLGDFGLATTLVGQNENSDRLISTIVDPKTPVNTKLTGQVGTQLYMSPEQFQHKPYDHKVDIYSLGIIFFELLVPFGTDMERHNELTKVRRLHFPKLFKVAYPEQYELIQSMVSHDPSRRPDAKEIKKYLEASDEYGLTKDIHLGSLRSMSFPDHLLEDQGIFGVGIRKKYGRGDKRRNIYKTHSAM